MIKNFKKIFICLSVLLTEFNKELTMVLWIYIEKGILG